MHEAVSAELIYLPGVSVAGGEGKASQKTLPIIRVTLPAWRHGQPDPVSPGEGGGLRLPLIGHV